MNIYATSVRLVCALIGLVIMVVMVPGALATENPGLHIQKAIPQTDLAGQGSFRWFGLKIYDAQLWVGPEGYDANQPLAEKFALDLHYARALEGRKIAEASEAQIAKLGIGTPEQRKGWLKEMIQLFPDVSDGTHLTGIYLPQQGTSFYLDGKQIGTIKDEDFSLAFFSIWLAPETSEPKLRNALLKNAVPH